MTFRLHSVKKTKLDFAAIILFTTFALVTDKICCMAKRILRYIIPLIALAIAFIGDASATGTVSASSPSNTSLSELRADYFVESTGIESSLYTARQLSPAGTTHIHGVAKRLSNPHKNNFEFIKQGKCFSTCIGGYIHQHQLSTHLSFTKSHHRLIGLGKLII